MTDEVTVNDIGITFRVTMTENDQVIDIGLATARRLYLKAPDGQVTEYAATLYTDGSDGILEYKTTAALGQRGKWQYRGGISFSATEYYNSPDWETFEVVK